MDLKGTTFGELLTSCWEVATATMFKFDQRMESEKREVSHHDCQK